MSLDQNLFTLNFVNADPNDPMSIDLVDTADKCHYRKRRNLSSGNSVLSWYLLGKFQMESLLTRRHSSVTL